MPRMEGQDIKVGLYLMDNTCFVTCIGKNLTLYGEGTWVMQHDTVWEPQIGFIW